MSRTLMHPGTILGDELAESGISAMELVRQLKIPTDIRFGYSLFLDFIEATSKAIAANMTDKAATIIV